MNDERREHAEATLDSLADAVLSTDLDGLIRYLNQAAEVLTGWSREAAIGRPLEEVFKIVGAGAECVSSVVTAPRQKSNTPARKSSTPRASLGAGSSSSAMPVPREKPRGVLRISQCMTL
jgi:PAS domain-containing protein